MFETILAAVDGSDHSDQAVHLAADIAIKYQARLTLLHVCPEGSVPEGLRRLASVEFGMPSGPAATRPDLSEGVGHIMDPVREGCDAASAAEIYEKLGHQILEHSKGIALEKGVAAVETLLDKGDAADVIVQQADRLKANVIVMGTRGLGTLKGLLVGSVSHKVTQLAPCTCVTVK